MKTKCKIKHFFNGFFHPFWYNELYLCPHCCTRCSKEEYNEYTMFPLGCKHCRSEEIYEEYQMYRFTPRVIEKMEQKLKELE